MGVFVQATLQLAFDPVRASAVQALPSLHVMAEQTTAAGATSQVSPVSMRPLPQPGQSTSIVGPHPVGQNPSAGPQVRLVVVQRYVQALTLPDEVRTLSTSDTQAVICVMQVLGGSQVSPVSTRPLPQPGQSTSIVGPHPVGQNPSAGPQVRLVVVQRYVQALTLPDEVRMLSASDTHAVIWVVQALGGSQVSPASTTLLPQAGWQSVSLVELQLDGQQPSLFAHAVCKLPLTHRTSQVAALPARTRSWQPTAGQAVGQLPSHSSPASTTPFPQRTTQSASLVVLQPAGQHESFGVQVVVVAPFTQRASQVDALPCSVRCWQPTAGQAVGQLPSHISPGSTTLLPQRGGQSESLTLVQAGRAAGVTVHARRLHAGGDAGGLARPGAGQREELAAVGPTRGRAGRHRIARLARFDAAVAAAGAVDVGRGRAGGGTARVRDRAAAGHRGAGDRRVRRRAIDRGTVRGSVHRRGVGRPVRGGVSRLVRRGVHRGQGGIRGALRRRVDLRGSVPDATVGAPIRRERRLAQTTPAPRAGRRQHEAPYGHPPPLHSVTMNVNPGADFPAGVC